MSLRLAGFFLGMVVLTGVGFIGGVLAAREGVAPIAHFPDCYVTAGQARQHRADGAAAERKRVQCEKEGKVACPKPE